MDIIGIRNDGSNLRFQYCNNQWHSLGVYNNPDFKIMKSNFDVGYNMIGKYNRWVHSCITSNNNVLYLYVDGNLISRVSLQSDWNSHLKLIYTANIGKIYLSDLRLYDSTLSPKQIKLLSQAMICHYPMGNVDGKIGGRNLIKNSTLINGKPTNFYQSNCNNCTSSYSKDGLSISNPSGGVPNNGISFKGEFKSLEITSGDTITFSFDVKGSTDKYANCNIILQGMNTTGNWWENNTITSKRVMFSAKQDEFSRFSVSLKIPDDISNFTNDMFWLQIHGGEAFNCIVKNLKLEKSSTSTPWTPAPEDNPPFYDNIIPDISGYQNNGEVTDTTCPTWSDDSPRYLGSYEFNGENQYISGLSPISSNTKEFTISFWTKLNNTSGVMTFYTARKSIGSGVALFFVNKNIRFDDNARFAFNYTCNLSSNKWTHLCVTRNNTSKKLYINGKLVDSTSKVGDMQNIGQHFTIGGSESSDSGIADMNWLNGNISDFRIYTTALSESDVLDLYQSSASLDSQGNLILSGEVIE